MTAQRHAAPHHRAGAPSPGLVTAVATAVAALAAGCAQYPASSIQDRPPADVTVPTSAPAAPVPAAASTAPPAAEAATPPVARSERLFQTPLPPPPSRSSAGAVPGPTSQSVGPALETAIDLQQLPLPVFIDTVFATILKRNVSMDPAIAQRRDLVSLRTGQPQTASQLFEATRAVLKSYGLAVTEYSGLVRVTPESGPTGYTPEIRRGRALPDVPASLRPIFQLVELESVAPGSVTGWLRTVFGQRVTVQDDLARQAVLISGQSDEVAAAMQAIQVLDQPTMRGRASARIAPLFWSADEMARRLSEVLQAQGYAVATNPNAQAPLLVLPIGPLNSVIVFASSEAVLNHALRWATELDQPASGRGTAGYFTYPVRNLDAADLAKTLQEVLNPGTAAAAPGAAPGVRSRVVVNPATNTLIIQGSSTEYQQWFGLLQELDRPARTALVSVTIAEVRLGDSEQLGFEWLLREFTAGGYTVAMSTLGAFGTAAIGGLAATISSSTSPARALFNALASTQRVRVLANPSVMARNGESAFIQVGDEVPIVTSQQTTGSVVNVPGGAANGVIQNIQYRNTGVVLRVKPVIHAGGRIDLDVEQEVSSASATRTGVSASPTISTRRISTKLSLSDGATVLLGGLMQESATVTDTGVPLLKDIPYAGYLFKSTSEERLRTELVVLITPYIIADEFEAVAISDAFRRQFSWDARTATQDLPRPHRDMPVPTQPRLPEAPPAGKPYTLPPAHAAPPPPPPQPGAGPSAPGPSIATPPAVDATPGGPTTLAPGASAPAGPGPAARPAMPVQDPQVLKELNELLKPKR